MRLCNRSATGSGSRLCLAPASRGTRRACLLAFWIVPLLLGVLAASGRAQENLPAPRDKVRCITALDGDSLLAEREGGPPGRFQIRLLGLDCPEKGQEYAERARKLSRKFCKGQVLELEYGPRRTDRYGRILAYVWTDGRMLNEELVSRGLALAVAYDEAERHAGRLARAEKDARAARAGFWAQGGMKMTPRRFRELLRRR
jgi:micrococcal nuclease